MSTGAKVAIALAMGLVGLIVLSVLAIALLGDEAETQLEPTGGAIDGGSPPEDAVVPDGYKLIEGDGVSIAAPDDWQELAPDDFEMTPDELEEAFPGAPPAFLDQATAAFEQGATLVAFDVDRDFSSNVNVASFPGEAPLSLLEEQATAQLEALGGTVVSTEPLRVPAGDALRIEYHLDVAAPDGSSVPADGVQYYVVADGRTHVVTVTTADEVGPLAATMINTFRAD